MYIASETRETLALAHVLQSSRDAVDRLQNALADVFGVGTVRILTEFLQQLNLNVVQRIDVRIADFDRLLQPRLGIQHFLRPCHLQQQLPAQLKFRFDVAEDGLSMFRFGKLRIKAGNRHVGAAHSKCTLSNIVRKNAQSRYMTFNVAICST